MKRKTTLIALIVVISILVLFTSIIAIVTKKDVFAKTVTHGSCTHDESEFEIEPYSPDGVECIHKFYCKKEGCTNKDAFLRIGTMHSRPLDSRR